MSVVVPAPAVQARIYHHSFITTAVQAGFINLAWIGLCLQQLHCVLLRDCQYRKFWTALWSSDPSSDRNAYYTWKMAVEQTTAPRNIQPTEGIFLETIDVVQFRQA